MKAVLLIAGLAACGGRGFPTATLDVAGRPLTVEVAATPEHRATGLMHREGLSDSEGMLFYYPTEHKVSFWMKNTRVPLSIAFIDRHGEIVRITDMQPHLTDPVPSLYPVQYALEVRQGWFADHGVVVGGKVGGLPPSVEVK